MRLFFSIIVGVIFWLAAQIIGLGLAGGGHGWNGPFFFSMSLIILYPVAFIRVYGGKAGSRDIDVVMLGVAGLLDMFVLMSFSSESKYITAMWRSDGGPLFILLWLALWVGWQLLIVLSILKRKRGQAAGTERS